MLVVIYAWSPPPIANIPDSGDFGVKTDDPPWSPKPLLEEKKGDPPVDRLEVRVRQLQIVPMDGLGSVIDNGKLAKGPGSFGPTTVSRRSA